MLATCCAAGLLMTSCNNFLDIKPYGKAIPKTTEEYSALINNILASMDGSTIYPIGRYLFFDNSMVSNMEQCSDNLETNLTEYPTGRMLRSYVGDLISSANYVHNYEVISRCNMVLDNFEDGRDTQAGKDLVGTAYALRGVAYYQLLRLYCPPVGSADAQLGVPIVTRFDMEDRPVRSSIEETVAQAESDLKAALDCHIQDEMCRFNDDVIKGCLARLYFWVGRFEEAKSLALDVLGRHPVLSNEAYEKMMTAVDGLEGNMLIRGEQIAVDGTASLNINLRYRPMSIRFVKLFAEKERDVRYNLFMDRKRKNTKFFFAGLRSAELALIAMESCCHLGQTDEALRMLNEFRNRRIADNVAFTMATLPAVDKTDYVQEDCQGKPLTPLLAAILNERRKEFYLEGDRFFELKRNGRPEFWVTKNGLKYTTKKFMYTFPIPVSDVQINPAIIQNEGYTEVVY